MTDTYTLLVPFGHPNRLVKSHPTLNTSEKGSSWSGSNDHSDSATHRHLKLIDANDIGQMENEICKQT